jgi:hemerythrin-like domain-containing protein
MLTATYTLVALSVEQASVRVSLQSLQKLLQSTFIDQSTLTPGQVGYACDAVRRLVDNCHWRKLDMFLIPAIRHATSEADQVLHDLDELARASADAATTLGNRIAELALESQQGVNQFCATIESFCSATLKRLEREEHELFPLARAVISGEAWFSIANAMLAHDAYVQETKPTQSRPGAGPRRRSEPERLTA